MIKNIIYDLGGVLLNIDYNKTKEAFERIGYEHFDEMYSQFKANQLFEDLETGDISTDEFYRTMLAESTKDIRKEDITNAWNAMLLDFRKESLLFLKRIEPDYKLFLLSNTNAIHYAEFSRTLPVQTGHTSLDGFFTKAWYSHQIGFRKPNRDIFDFVLADAHIIAEETMFVDDTFNNVETAREMGFRGHLLMAGERIEESV